MSKNFYKERKKFLFNFNFFLFLIRIQEKHYFFWVRNIKNYISDQFNLNVPEILEIGYFFQI